MFTTEARSSRRKEKNMKILKKGLPEYPLPSPCSPYLRGKWFFILILSLFPGTILAAGNLTQAQMVDHPYLALFPGAAIALTVYGCNMLGDALRDTLDPRLRRGA